MAKKIKEEIEVDKLEAMKKTIAKYEQMFGEIDEFLQFVHRERDELKEADAAVAEAKAVYDEAKARAQGIRDSISGTKDALFRMLEPGAAKFMPLFDKMEPADEEKHGEHSDEWRKAPISALRLSAVSCAFLIDADIVLVGQLQDRVLADGANWWQEITGLTVGIAAAIVDRLNDFIFRQGWGA